MNADFTALPVVDFHVVAFTAARRTLNELLPACFRAMYTDEGRSVPVRLQARINALRARYEYTLSNRVLKAFDDAEQIAWKGNSTARDTLAAVQAIAGADRDIPAQLGVAMAARQVAGALRKLREQGEFAGTVDISRLSHHILEVQQEMDEALGQVVQAWLQSAHPELAGQAWSICDVEPSCPVIILSAKPRETLVDVEDLKPQWVQLRTKAEPLAINRALGVALAEFVDLSRSSES